MGFFSGLTSFFNRTTKTEKWNGAGGGFFYYNGFGDVSKTVTLENDNAYLLSKSIAEIYNPIDIIADRVASVDYELIDKKTLEIVDLPLNIKRLMEKSNALESFGVLVYKIQFALLASGGADIYRNIGDAKKGDSSNINSIWLLEPDKTTYNYKSTIPSNPFDIMSMRDLVESATTIFGNKHTIESKDIVFNSDGGFCPIELHYISPLLGAKKNIENLIMVYQARYNQYKNNGAAGILSKKLTPQDEFSHLNPVERQDIINEMNQTDGIIGGKNFIGVSTNPLEFIKTIGTIRELMPFEETKDAQLKIAGIYNVSKHLLPTNEGTTFANQKDAEKNLWQNTIIPYCYSMAKILNDVFLIDENYTLRPIFDGIEILQDDRKVSLEADKMELEIIEKAEAMGLSKQEIKEKWEI